MKVIELIKELEKYPEDCEIKVNCIMVRSGWQYTYHAVLTAGRVDQPRKSENVVTINPVIFNSYGMKVVAMNSGVPIIKTINSLLNPDDVTMTLSEEQRRDLERAKQIIANAMVYSDEQKMLGKDRR